MCFLGSKWLKMHWRLGSTGELTALTRLRSWTKRKRGKGKIGEERKRKMDGRESKKRGREG